MARLFVVILLILLISESCTVTKRVHLKGWHVAWHPIKSSARESKIAIDGNNSTSLPAALSLQNVDELPGEETQVIEPKKTTLEIDSSLSSSTANDQIREEKVVEMQSAHVNNRRNPLNLKIVPERKNSIEDPQRGSANYSTPVLLFVLGLISILFAIIFYLLVGSSATFSSAIIAVLGVVFFAVLALILIISGFVMLGVATSNAYRSSVEN